MDLIKFAATLIMATAKERNEKYPSQRYFISLLIPFHPEEKEESFHAKPLINEEKTIAIVFNDVIDTSKLFPAKKGITGQLETTVTLEGKRNTYIESDSSSSQGAAYQCVVLRINDHVEFDDQALLLANGYIGNFH